MTKTDDASGGKLLRLTNDCLLLLVGRSGIRVGASFIRGLDGEYGHPTDAAWQGTGGEVPERLRLRKSTFYLPRERGSSEQEVPRVRAVAIDLDSKTVDEVGLRDRLAGSLNYTGGGAEMLWPQGYGDAGKLKQEIVEVLESAGAASVRNFILFHATSQGTGSGVASWIVDLIRARYGRTPGQTRNLLAFTVVPSGNTEESLPYKEFEEVSGPSYYNTVLTLNTLFGVRPGQPAVAKGALRSLTVLMDNPAVARAYEQATGEFPRDPTFAEINHVMARAALGLTGILRYGPTDIGNVLVYMNDKRSSSYAFPVLGPVAADGEERPPFTLAYDALMGTRLLQGAIDPERIYFVLRGAVDRSGIRHIHDLFLDHFHLSADFFNIVERGTPGYPTEFVGLVRPKEVPQGLRRVAAMAREQLREKRHLDGYEAWGMTAEDLDGNVAALTEYLRPGAETGDAP